MGLGGYARARGVGAGCDRGDLSMPKDEGETTLTILRARGGCSSSSPPTSLRLRLSGVPVCDEPGVGVVERVQAAAAGPGATLRCGLSARRSRSPAVLRFAGAARGARPGARARARAVEGEAEVDAEGVGAAVGVRRLMSEEGIGARRRAESSGGKGTSAGVTAAGRPARRSSRGRLASPAGRMTALSRVFE